MNELALPTTIAGWAIALIVIVAIVGVVVVVIRVAKIPIPSWIIDILWILGVAFVGIAAIKLLMRM